jgi:K+-transporting ATPase KdpF subunit
VGLREALREGLTMLLAIAGALALGLIVYLFVALLFPERLS